MMATVQRQDDITIVEVQVDYDSLSGPAFDEIQRVLLAQAQSAEPPLVVLDLSHTDYIGSGFIETISRSWKRLTARNGCLVLCGVQPFCAEVIRTMRLDTLWKAYPTRADALAAIGQFSAG